MLTKRAHVVLPQDVVKEIDKIAGARGRSAFLTDLARREIKRQRMLALLKSDKQIWKDKDHPELCGGAVEWVRKLRAESEARFDRIQKQRVRA